MVSVYGICFEELSHAAIRPPGAPQRTRQPRIRLRRSEFGTDATKPAAGRAAFKVADMVGSKRVMMTER
ncbi:MAG: hypothetical protein CTR54_11895 [Rhizobium sp.]|nr:MAG: hypothetical protein CTR54_11895 [Rhizobium sp.]